MPSALTCVQLQNRKPTIKLWSLMISETSTIFTPPRFEVQHQIYPLINWNKLTPDLADLVPYVDLCGAKPEPSLHPFPVSCEEGPSGCSSDSLCQLAVPWDGNWSITITGCQPAKRPCHISIWNPDLAIQSRPLQPVDYNNLDQFSHSPHLVNSEKNDDTDIITIHRLTLGRVQWSIWSLFHKHRAPRRRPCKRLPRGKESGCQSFQVSTAHCWKQSSLRCSFLHFV